MIVCYKKESDDPNTTTDPMKNSATPELTTVLFRDPPVNKPENQVLGVMFESLVAYGDYFNWTVQNSSHWMYAGTGLSNGSTIPKLGGYEWDKIYNNGVSPAGMTVVSQTAINNSEGSFLHQAVIWQHPSCAWVFAASSNYWQYMLDGNWIWPVDTRVRRMTQNILARMISEPTCGSQATFTPVPNVTNTPTRTATATATRTATGTATRTSTVTPTATRTNTPTNVCALLTVTNTFLGDQTFSYTIQNGNATAGTITQADLVWRPNSPASMYPDTMSLSSAAQSFWVKPVAESPVTSGSYSITSSNSGWNSSFAGVPASGSTNWSVTFASGPIPLAPQYSIYDFKGTKINVQIGAQTCVLDPTAALPTVTATRTATAGASSTATRTPTSTNTAVGPTATWTATRTSTATSTATTSTGGQTFYRGINLGGPAIVVDGNNWQDNSGTTTNLTTNGAVVCNPWVPLTPTTDTNRATMISCSRQHWAHSVVMSSVPNGSYQVSLYVWLDWADPNPTAFSIQIEGATVVSNYVPGPAGKWDKLGPFNVTISDSTINITTSGGVANLSGIEVWSGSGGGTTATNTAVAASATATATMTRTSTPTNTPNVTATATRTPTRTNTPGGPTATATRTSTRTNTPLPASATPTRTPTSSGGVTFYRGINLGGAAIAVDGNNWEANTGTTTNLTTNGTAMCNQWVTLNPTTDANRTTMIQCSRQHWAHSMVMSNVPNGNYQISLYVWLDWADPNPTAYSIQIEGTTVVPSYVPGPAGKWSKLGPFNVTISDGTINITTSGGIANLSGLEVWRIG
ncbi:MAG: hypothetical protein KF726_17550 [Anaerolineae bacterium]|nr:hypothetical protein [Anaerolineae bacterium]